MALRPQQAKALLEMVLGTRDQEMTCDACLAEIAAFVEVQLTGAPLSASGAMSRLYRRVPGLTSGACSPR
jgi:hypothetical protein